MWPRRLQLARPHDVEKPPDLTDRSTDRLTHEATSLESAERSIFHRLQKFLLVGAGGLVVNMGGLVVLTEIAGFHYLVSALIAIEASHLFTFAFNEIWTWEDRRSGRFANRFLKYHLVNGTGLGINVGVLFALVIAFGLHYFAANFVGAAASAVWNFVVNHLFTWARERHE